MCPQTESSPASSSPSPWVLPPIEDLEQALHYFWQRPRKLPPTTLIFKLHNPSKRKIQRVLPIQAHVTNLMADVLEAWREDPYRAREDGAIAAIFDIQENDERKLYRAATLATRIYQLLDAHQKEKGSPLRSELRDGMYRACAQTLMAWVQKQTNLITEPKHDVVLTREQFRSGWQALEEAYQRAMEIIVTLSLHPDTLEDIKDHKLERQSKHDAHWVLERLKSEDDLRNALKSVNALLDSDPSAEQRIAAFETHPWQRGNKPRRRVRESWFFQRLIDPSDNYRVLGQLQQNERESLRDELHELLGYLEQAGSVIERIDTQHLFGNGSIDERFRRVLETFLNKKPHSYPTVERVLITGKTSQDGIPILYRRLEEPGIHIDLDTNPEELYQRRLEWFLTDSKHAQPMNRFLSQKNEAREVQGMFQSLRALRQPELQPIHFKGTARPMNVFDGKKHTAQQRYFALLYDRKTYRLTVAIFIQNKQMSLEIHDEQEDQGRREQQKKMYQNRREANPLYYVNFPETPFIPPATSSVMLFPVECGEEYHMQQHIRPIIEVQRFYQQQRHRELNQEGQKNTPIRYCLPSSTPIASGCLKCELDKHGYPTFYFHAHIAPGGSERDPFPAHVLGICAYDQRYAYAVLSLTGEVKFVGDLHMASFIDPEQHGPRWTDNAVYGIANEIVFQSWLWDAFIGIEDASYKKRQAQANHAANQQLFGMPLQRIAKVTSDKALLAGQMPPRLVSGVSQYRCAKCQSLAKKVPKKTFKSQWTVQCPKCHYAQTIVGDTNYHDCLACEHRWMLQEEAIRLEQYFFCFECSASPIITRHNIAIVVAQKTLIETVEHFKNIHKQKQRA